MQLFFFFPPNFPQQLWQYMRPDGEDSTRLSLVQSDTSSATKRMCASGAVSSDITTSCRNGIHRRCALNVPLGLPSVCSVVRKTSEGSSAIPWANLVTHRQPKTEWKKIIPSRLWGKPGDIAKRVSRGFPGRSMYAQVLLELQGPE